MQPNRKKKFLACDECNTYYHVECAGPSKKTTESEKWYCAPCRKHPKRNAATTVMTLKQAHIAQAQFTKLARQHRTEETRVREENLKKVASNYPDEEIVELTGTPNKVRVVRRRSMFDGPWQETAEYQDPPAVDSWTTKQSDPARTNTTGDSDYALHWARCRVEQELVTPGPKRTEDLELLARAAYWKNHFGPSSHHPQHHEKDTRETSTPLAPIPETHETEAPDVPANTHTGTTTPTPPRTALTAPGTTTQVNPGEQTPPPKAPPPNSHGQLHHFSPEKIRRIIRKHGLSLQDIRGDGTCALYAHLSTHEARRTLTDRQFREEMKWSLRGDVLAGIRTKLANPSTEKHTLDGLKVSIDDHYENRYTHGKKSTSKTEKDTLAEWTRLWTEENLFPGEVEITALQQVLSERERRTTTYHGSWTSTGHIHVHETHRNQKGEPVHSTSYRLGETKHDGKSPIPLHDGRNHYYQIYPTGLAAEDNDDEGSGPPDDSEGEDDSGNGNHSGYNTGGDDEDYGGHDENEGGDKDGNQDGDNTDEVGEKEREEEEEEEESRSTRHGRTMEGDASDDDNNRQRMRWQGR
jgi:hypothetical protein